MAADRTYDVEIEFTDGETRLVSEVSISLVQGGVLQLSRMHTTLGKNTHLGSYPIANVKCWTRKED